MNRTRKTKPKPATRDASMRYISRVRSNGTNGWMIRVPTYPSKLVSIGKSTEEATLHKAKTLRNKLLRTHIARVMEED